jgi:hypothetical protein
VRREADRRRGAHCRPPPSSVHARSDPPHEAPRGHTVVGDVSFRCEPGCVTELLVSSERSQRTALVTFALVPRRERVVAAKLPAGVVVALGALVVCLAVAAAGTALAAPGVETTAGSARSGRRRGRRSSSGWRYARVRPPRILRDEVQS